MGAHHSHGHDHVHDHSNGQHHRHGHAHAPANFGRAFAVGVALNLGFVVVEAVFGFVSGSMALVADAGHNLSDVLGLLIAWYASVVSKRPPTARFTYGLKSSTILAALANAMLLLIAIGVIAFEAVFRLLDPVKPEGLTMIYVAGLGIAINTATALMFMRGGQHDLNIRGAFLHMAADALVSAGVVVAGILILYTELSWIDPLVSLLILIVIAWGTWRLLRDGVTMGLAAVPNTVDQDAVYATLKSLPGVVRVHDLHIWSLSTTETALTAHLVIPNGHSGDSFLQRATDELRHRHRIGHVTLQVESGAGICGGCG